MNKLILALIGLGAIGLVAVGIVAAGIGFFFLMPQDQTFSGECILVPVSGDYESLQWEHEYMLENACTGKGGPVDSVDEAPTSTEQNGKIRDIVPIGCADGSIERFCFEITLDSSEQENYRTTECILVPMSDETSGVAWEYDYLEKNACIGKGRIADVSQELKSGETEDEIYDILYVECGDGTTEEYCFDIKNFFGTWK